ncbi:unnamed protein product [Diamesa serratosioi]
MATLTGVRVHTACDDKLLEDIYNLINKLIASIKEFNNKLTEFFIAKRKSGKELWTLVTQYNVLNRGGPGIYPAEVREEMMEEFLVNIQDKTSCISNDLLSVKQQFEDLPKCLKAIEKQCSELDWSSTSLAVTGTPIQLPISFYVDEISDILYQYDVALICMLQYFNVINLRDPISYENLLKSFTFSSQLIEFVDEFLLKCNSHVV